MIYELQTTQRHRKGILLGMGLILATLISITATAGGAEPDWTNTSQAIGTLLIATSVAGRCWCVAVMGRRKKTELVTWGPFSLSRNPLYLFTIIGALGVGLTSEAILIALVVAGGTFLVHDQVIRYEEAFLRERFGAAFEAYCRTTPRWLSLRAKWMPKPSSSRPDWALVLRRGAESVLLFFAIPVMEGVDYMHAVDALPVLLCLP